MVEPRAALRVGRPRLGPILAATICVPDLALARESYRSVLGFEAVDGGVVPDELAASWQAPGTTGAAWVLLASPSRVAGGIRLVERSPAAGDQYAPLRTYGWAAIELVVRDVDAVAAAVDGAAAFTVLAPAIGLGDAPDPALRAMQVVGPAGEPLYLTQIRRPVPGFELPTTADAVGGVFIVVLATSELPVARAFYEDAFAVRRASDRSAAIRVLNRAFGLAPSTGHRLSSLQLTERCAIELDQYPAGASAREHRAELLPPGVAIVTAMVDAPDTTGWLPGPRCAPYRGAATTTRRGVQGELLELVARR